MNHHTIRFPPPRLVMVALVALVVARQSAAAEQYTSAPTAQRNQMVEQEIIGAGVKNPRVIESMRNTPRHEFVMFRDRQYAYYDMALPIGEGQTISPPFIVAYMSEQLDPQPADKVLEIGTGSGYQAAVLSPLVDAVYTIEIVPTLGRNAARTLKRLKYTNVFSKVGDGYEGWPEHAPFDKIIVTCSPEKVPRALVDQLQEGGRLIVPLGERFQQVFYLFKKKDGKLVSEALRPTLFVPMTGAAESQREVQPDPLDPKIINGSFEDSTMEGQREIPSAWHYARQVEMISDKLSPAGERFARFANDVAGRGSQALQGFAIDGRQIRELEISLSVRAKEVRPGKSNDELPMVVITFYNERQEMVGHRGVGPWRGSFPWQREKEQLAVPPGAQTAIIRVGLLGAVGELDLDGIELRKVEP